MPAAAAVALTRLVGAALRYPGQGLGDLNEPNLPGYGWPVLDVTVQESATVYATPGCAAISRAG